jgi:putative membrane protein
MFFGMPGYGAGCGWGYGLGSGFGAGYGWLGWLGFGLHGVLMLAFWGVLIWAAIVLVRYVSRGGGGGRREDAAPGILRERYARGELTAEQYADMRRALR